MKVIAEHGDSGQLQESQKHGPFQLEGPSEKTSPSLSSPTAEVPEDNDWLKATQQGGTRPSLTLGHCPQVCCCPTLLLSSHRSSPAFNVMATRRQGKSLSNVRKEAQRRSGTGGGREISFHRSPSKWTTCPFSSVSHSCSPFSCWWWNR